MYKIILTICVLAGFVAWTQANPNIFRLPNGSDIEKLKEVFFEEESQNQSGQWRQSGNNNGNGQRQHSGNRNLFNNDNSSNNRHSRNHLSKDSSEDFSGEDQPASVSNLKKDANKFADETVKKLHAKISENGLNEVALPTETREFRKKFYGITYHGKAVLDQGYMRGFQNIRRIGDATLHGHANGTQSVSFETEFTDMEVGYTLQIAFMMQKIPQQQVKGYLNSVTAQIEALVDKNGKLLLTRFDITDAGHFKFQTTGLGSFNFLLDRVVDTIGNLTKRVILESMEGKIRLLLNAILNDSVYPVNALFSSVQSELYSKFSTAMSKIQG